MCGIAGFFGLPSSTSGALRELGGAMCERIRHRGPDGGGVTERDGVVLGMVRLAIVDVEHGQQPMFSDDRNIAMVFNGEIYNAPALRKDLEAKGVRFHTRSDTEVILRLYEHSPSDVERHLRGMWAFAIHDARRRKLVLSRDRFGIKPLFVADAGHAVAFASELRAFEPLQSTSLGHLFELDPGAAHAMLSWSYVPNEDTILRGVKRLASATRLEVDVDGPARTSTKFYELRPSAEAARVRTLGDACALVDPLLRQSVKEHLESDVPIAAFLSGGVDSSLVLAYAVEESTKPVKPFTIGFREKRFDESPYARAVAKQLGVDVHVEVFDEAAARESLDDAVAAYDEPFGDSSSLANFLLSRVVARTHKVALGGDGGDEVFAGYKKHQILRIREYASRMPRLASAAGALLSRMPGNPGRAHAYDDVVRVARRTGRALDGDDATAYLRLTQVAPLESTATLVRKPTDTSRFVDPILRTFRDAQGTPLQRTLISDIANVLPNAMLTKVDRASMACRLEARVPFLDHRVVEVGIGLDDAFTLRPKGKHVLRELYARRFGRELAERRKTGFDVPVESWLKGFLRPRCAELLRPDSPVYEVLSPSFAQDWEMMLERDPQVSWHVYVLATWMARQQ